MEAGTFVCFVYYGAADGEVWGLRFVGDGEEGEEEVEAAVG